LAPPSGSGRSPARKKRKRKLFGEDDEGSGTEASYYSDDGSATSASARERDSDSDHGSDRYATDEESEGDDQGAVAEADTAVYEQETQMDAAIFDQDTEDSDDGNGDGAGGSEAFRRPVIRVRSEGEGVDVEPATETQLPHTEMDTSAMCAETQTLLPDDTQMPPDPVDDTEDGGGGGNTGGNTQPLPDPEDDSESTTDDSDLD